MWKKDLLMCKIFQLYHSENDDVDEKDDDDDDADEDIYVWCLNTKLYDIIIYVKKYIERWWMFIYVKNNIKYTHKFYRLCNNVCFLFVCKVILYITKNLNMVKKL